MLCVECDWVKHVSAEDLYSVRVMKAGSVRKLSNHPFFVSKIQSNSGEQKTEENKAKAKEPHMGN